MRGRWECRVAVVDDDETVRRSIGRLVRAYGFEAKEYSSGEEFLRSLEAFEPDCVVLDIHMPDIDGFETQARLAAAGPGIPVVVVTGHDGPGSRERAIAGGASDYLRKPVESLELIRAIREAMAGRGHREP